MYTQVSVKGGKHVGKRESPDFGHLLICRGRDSESPGSDTITDGTQVVKF